MASASLCQPLRGEHFWKRAFLVTALVYGGVLGVGFWQRSDSFVLQTSAFDGDPSETADARDSRLEVNLEAAAPESVLLTAPQPEALPVPPQPPQPVPTPLPSPPLPTEAPDFPVPAPLPPAAPILQKPAEAAPLPVPKPTPPSTKAATPRPAASSTKASPGESAGTSGGSGPTSSGVTLGSRDFPMPPYPPGAIERRWQGTVVLNINVLDGSIQEVAVTGSSGYALLDTSAVRWIRARWHFPKQVTRSFNQKIRFELAN